MKTFTLKDTASDGELCLSRLQEIPQSEGLFTCHAEFRSLGVSIVCEIEGYDAGMWGSYFAEIAANWRGWEGKKICQGYLDGLRLSAAADRLGHISLAVTIRTTTPVPWTFEALIILESGQLDAVAIRAKEFFGEVFRYTSYRVVEA